MSLRAIPGFLFFIVLSPPSVLYAAQNPEAQRLVAEGVALSQTKNYDKAIPLFSQAIEKQPDYSAAYLNRGIAYHAKGDAQNSIDDLTRAVQLEPTAVAYYNLAEAHLAGKNLQEAVDAFTASLKIEPKNGYALIDRGAAYMELGRFKEAIKDFDTILNTIAKVQNVYFYRGLAHYRMKSLKAAIRDFTSAIELGEPDAPANTALAYYYRGSAKMDAKDRTGAASDLRNAVSMDDSLLPDVRPLLDQLRPSKRLRK